MMGKCAAVLGIALMLAGCAGSPVGDAIAGPEKLAQADDTYCRSIGAAGPEYTKCRLFVTQQRDNKHARALAAFRPQPTLQCVTMGPPEARTTTCQ